MAKNRKTQSAAVRFGPAVKVFLLCLVIGGAGVGYVHQKYQIVALSERMKTLEAKSAKLSHGRQLLQGRLAHLQSAAILEQQVSRMNLGLVPTPPDQVLHLAGSAQNKTNKTGRLYAGQAIETPSGR